MEWSSCWPFVFKETLGCLLIRGRRRRMQLGSLVIKKTFSNITGVSLSTQTGLLYPNISFFWICFWKYSEVKYILYYFTSLFKLLTCSLKCLLIAYHIKSKFSPTSPVYHWLPLLSAPQSHLSTFFSILPLFCSSSFFPSARPYQAF